MRTVPFSTHNDTRMHSILVASASSALNRGSAVITVTRKPPMKGYVIPPNECSK